MLTPPPHAANRNAAERSFLETTRFDRVISLGENCGCANYLRAFYLRDAAYPFDWLGGAAFKRRVELILNDFLGFLEKDNLEKVGTHEKGDIYKDKNIGLISPHDFSKGAILDRAYPEVIKKYQRRIKRLYSTVNEVKYVLFVWWVFTGENISDEDIIDTQERLSRKFNKNIYLLIIQNNNASDKIEERCLGKFIIKIIAHINNGGNTDGDITIGNAIFSRIKTKNYLRVKIYRECIRKLLNIVGCFLPSKSLHHKVRARLKRELLGDDW